MFTECRDQGSRRPKLRQDFPSIIGDSCRIRIEPLRGLTQISRADDVVAFEHRPCLVPGRLHRDSFRHTGSHQVADGGPPKVVRDPPGAASDDSASLAAQPFAPVRTATTTLARRAQNLYRVVMVA